MAKEDFSTYTEVDPRSIIVVGTRRVTWTDMMAGDDATYVYLDKGAAFFAGDFFQPMTFNITASERGGSQCIIWAMTNDLDDFQGLIDNSKDFLAVGILHAQNPDATIIRIHEGDSGTEYSSASGYTITDGIPYYITMIRDETVGTYGTFYCRVYTDSARTVLVNTQSITLHTSKKNYRYIIPCMSYDATSGAAKQISGYSEDLEISTVLTGILELANTYLTDFTDTTVTGNAYIVNTGLSSVTQHGHCWSTSYDPTTADNKTTNGAGVLGLFSSSITGLITGQQYYTRPYATNTEGTAYGPNIRFTAGRSNLTLLTGEIAVVQTRLHYVGNDGKERWLEGTLV